MKLLIALLCTSILVVGMLVNSQVHAGQRRNAVADYDQCRLGVDNLYRDNLRLRRIVKTMKHKLLEQNQ